MIRGSYDGPPDPGPEDTSKAVGLTRPFNRLDVVSTQFYTGRWVQYIDAAHSKNAIPVLVTPTPRLDFSDGEFHNDFVDYCAAIKQVGADTGTRVIDLQTKGLAYYNSIGFEAVVADVSLPPMDVLHFQANGAFQMARLVSEGVKESDLPIAKFVK